jgi:hypothetical protein
MTHISQANGCYNSLLLITEHTTLPGLNTSTNSSSSTSSSSYESNVALAFSHSRHLVCFLAAASALPPLPFDNVIVDARRFAVLLFLGEERMFDLYYQLQKDK